MHCTFGDRENVIYIHFSLLFVGVSGSHHSITFCVWICIWSFRSAAACRFPWGGSRASSCLRGLDHPSIPIGVVRPPLHCTFGDGENVFYTHFSLLFVGVSGSHHSIIFCVWICIWTFRSAAAGRFPWGGSRASSCLRGLDHPSIPSESSGLRCAALLVMGRTSFIHISPYCLWEGVRECHSLKPFFTWIWGSVRLCLSSTFELSSLC